jgi:glycosyltransferase involved in cell wall biosynthesis
MIGTDMYGTGGISAVVLGYKKGGLFDRFDCTYVTSHRYGPIWRKVRTAVTSWVRLVAELHRLDAPLVHVMISSHGSFWRKSVVCLITRAMRRPYLLHVHGGSFVHFYDHECTRPTQRLVRSIFDNAALVVALSDEWRTRLQRIFPNSQFEVLPNAVHLPDTAVSTASHDGAQTLLFLGHLLRAKGVHDLVRAFARIAPVFPHLKLVFGGVGEIRELRQLATELGVAERVEFPGWLTPERTAAALGSATAFVLPSYAEGLPMALLEAMSWRLPVIAAPVGGIPQLVRDGYNGLLVPPGDIEALAGAIARLMNDPLLRERLGRAARATVESNHSRERMLERLSQIYQQFGIAARASEEAL